VFGHQHFRSGQEEALMRVLNGQVLSLLTLLVQQVQILTLQTRSRRSSSQQLAAASRSAFNCRRATKAAPF